MKVLILMTSTAQGHDEAENGSMLPVKTYEKGQKYLVSKSLADCFLSLKQCSFVLDEPKKEVDNHSDKMLPNEDAESDSQVEVKKPSKKAKK